MLKVTLIIVAVFGVLLIFRLLFIGSVPRHTGLTFSGLKRYIKYLATALADRGSITIELSGSPCELQLAKQEPKRSPASLVLRFRSGTISRTMLAKVYAVLVDSGAEIELKRTRLRRLVKEVSVPFDPGDPFTPTAIINTMTSVLPALGVEDQPAFTVVCWGPFKPSYSHEDGDAIPRPFSYRVGHATGRVIGALLHIFREKGE
jgi:hypothetical protein